MSKYRFFIKSALNSGAEVCLQGQEAAHLRTVLRLKSGDEVILFNGENIEANASIRSIERNETILFIDSIATCSRESSLQIHLYQGLSKGERMDTVVQKAVELGVSEFTPLLTQFTAFSLDKKRLDKKMAHWQKIIENACAQSMRNQLMILNSPRKLQDVIGTCDADLSLMLHTAVAFDPPVKKTVATVALWVGPEGGFSEEEVTIAKNQGTQVMQLGPRILRTETAAITACSLMQWQYGDFSH